MTYKLFLDDERDPPDGEWIVVRTVAEAVSAVKTLGFPAYVSFDHDLGENQQTGHDFAKWLVDWDMDHDILTRVNFAYYVHSQNPIGKENIEGTFTSYFRSKFG